MALECYQNTSTAFLLSQRHPKEPQLDVEGLNDSTTDLFGLKPSDLQTSVSIADGVATGTLLNIPTDSEFYTNAGFDSSIGTHFLVIKATPYTEGDTVSFTIGQSSGTLDSDGILVLQMYAERQALPLTFTESGETSLEVEIDLSSLTLEV